LTGPVPVEIVARAKGRECSMSDLPPAVEKYFKDRGKDPARLNQMPKVKEAFVKLKPKELDAIDMLNTLGKGLEDADDAALSPEERLQHYIYAIH
jgi:hypothetical protein